jgi:hypothetical protein
VVTDHRRSAWNQIHTNDVKPYRTISQTVPPGDLARQGDKLMLLFSSDVCLWHQCPRREGSRWWHTAFHLDHHDRRAIRRQRQKIHLPKPVSQVASKHTVPGTAEVVRGNPLATGSNTNRPRQNTSPPFKKLHHCIAKGPSTLDQLT